MVRSLVVSFLSRLAHDVTFEAKITMTDASLWLFSAYSRYLDSFYYISLFLFYKICYGGSRTVIICMYVQSWSNFNYDRSVRSFTSHFLTDVKYLNLFPNGVCWEMLLRYSSTHRCNNFSCSFNCTHIAIPTEQIFNIFSRFQALYLLNIVFCVVQIAASRNMLVSVTISHWIFVVVNTVICIFVLFITYYAVKARECQYSFYNVFKGV